jgi:hypothetical protein
VPASHHLAEGSTDSGHGSSNIFLSGTVNRLVTGSDSGGSILLDITQRQLPLYAEVDTPLLVHRIAMVLALELAISTTAAEDVLTSGDGDSILLSGSGGYILLLDITQCQLPLYAEVDTPLLVHWVAMVLALELAISSTAVEDVLTNGDGDSILLSGGGCILLLDIT